MAHMTRVTRHTNLASCVGSHLIGIPFILSNIFTKDVFIYIVMYIYIYICMCVCVFVYSYEHIYIYISIYIYVCVCVTSK